MAEQKLIRATDSQIVHAFKAICAALEATRNNLSFTILADGHPATINTNLEQIDTDEDLSRILERNSVLLQVLTLALPSFGNCNIQVHRAEPVDTLRVTFRQNTDLHIQIRVLAVVDQHLRTFKPTPISEAVLGRDLADFYRSRDETVVRLEQLNAEIIRQNEEYRRRLESDFSARRTDLEESQAARRTELEHEFASKLEALQEEKRALDDRSARHARREQFRLLKTVLQGRNTDFTLTKGTIRKRLPTHVLFVMLLGTLGILAGVLAYQQLMLNKPDPYYGLRLPAAVLAFVFGLIYYIRWNDDWFRRHADEEFRLKKYDLDMDRAGWLVELAIEAFESGEEPVPEELLRRLSGNLFGMDQDSEPIRYPADDFRNALLEAAGEIEVNIPGIGKVLLNRRQLKRLQRDVERGRIKLPLTTSDDRVLGQTE